MRNRDPPTASKPMQVRSEGSSLCSVPLIGEIKWNPLN